MQPGSLAEPELDVQLVEVGPYGARIEQPQIRESLEGRRVTLIYKLQIFGGNTLRFPARVIAAEGGQLQLAFVGAPSRGNHE